MVVAIRNGDRMRLLKTIVLSPGNRFEEGIEVVVQHYLLQGVDERGYVRPEEDWLRVETYDGRVVHVKRDELTFIRVPMRRLLAWLQWGVSDKKVRATYEELAGMSASTDEFILTDGNVESFIREVERTAKENGACDEHFDHHKAHAALMESHAN